MVFPAHVLIIAPESQDRDRLETIFLQSGVHVFLSSSLLEAQSFLSGHPVSVVFAQNTLPDSDFRAVLAGVARFQKNVPVVALTRSIDWDSYLHGMAEGAFDCLTVPVSKLEGQRVLWSALQASSAALLHAATAA